MTSIITQRSLRSFAAAATVAALLVGPAIASAAVLTRSLDFGATGSDVSSLQTFLAQDTSVYPEGLVTGYFGSLTQAAVQRFQVKNNIVSNGTPASTGYGRVGPTTRASINAQMGGVVSTGDVTVPVLSNVIVTTSNTGATISWNTNEATKGSVYYSTSVLSEYEYPHYVTISGTVAMTDTALRTAHSVNISGLTPNTVYHYDVYVTDAAGNATMTMQNTFKTTN